MHPPQPVVESAADSPMYHGLASAEELRLVLRLAEGQTSGTSAPTRLQIGKKLGRGSEGDVYKATFDGFRVALKVIKRRDRRTPKEWRKVVAEFLAEARLLRACQGQDTILGLHAAVEFPSSYLMELEAATRPSPMPVFGLLLDLSQRGTLRDLVERQMNEPEAVLYSDREALSWCIDVAAAVRHLHQLTPIIIHRDIKLENVLLFNGKDRSTAKLCDFGLAAIGYETLPLSRRSLRRRIDSQTSRQASCQSSIRFDDTAKLLVAPASPGAATLAAAERAVAADAAQRMPSQQQQSAVSEHTVNPERPAATVVQRTQAAFAITGRSASTTSSSLAARASALAKDATRSPRNSGVLRNSADGDGDDVRRADKGSPNVMRRVSIQVLSAPQDSSNTLPPHLLPDAGTPALQGTRPVSCGHASMPGAASSGDPNPRLLHMQLQQAQDQEVASTCGSADHGSRHLVAAAHTSAGGNAEPGRTLGGLSTRRRMSVRQTVAFDLPEGAGQPPGADGADLSNLVSDDPNEESFHVRRRLSRCSSTGSFASRASSVSVTGRTGSLAYLAPEVDCRKAYNESADVFSFAVLMYQLFARKSLVLECRDTEGALEKLQTRMTEGFRPNKPEGCHDDVWEVIEACWQPTSTDRPMMDEVMQQLEAVVIELPIVETKSMKNLISLDSHYLPTAAATAMVTTGGAGGAPKDAHSPPAIKPAPSSSPPDILAPSCGCVIC